MMPGTTPASVPRRPTPVVGEDTDPRDTLARASRDIARFFEGELGPEELWFSYKYDIDDLGGFSQAVLRGMSSIPPGQVRTYGWIASQAGRPGAPRAAGSVVGANRLGPLVPCHRVVGAGGTLTGFGGGLPFKVALLALEYQTCYGPLQDF
jgi:methylated-DNA-[protein]-cysteine S-methyltransferase